MNWLFRKRSLNHPTFGKLTPFRDGKFWRGRVNFFGPAERRVWVALHAGDGGDSEPTGDQERLYLALANRYGAVLPKLLKVLHREYQRVRRCHPSAGRWPDTADPREMQRVMVLDEIWIEDLAGQRMVLSYMTKLDKQQHFHVFFRNGKLESVAAEHG